MALNLMMFAIDELPHPYSLQMRKYRILIRLFDAWGLMMAASNLFGAMNLTMFKSDGFTYGKMFGILIKLVVQFKLRHITGSQSYLDKGSMVELIAF